MLSVAELNSRAIPTSDKISKERYFSIKICGSEITNSVRKLLNPSG